MGEHGMADQTRERDPRAKAREARSEPYSEQDLKGQRRWYVGCASAYKQHTQVLGLLAISAGVVALIKGWQRIARYGETWAAYRTASDRMKREQRPYVNGAGAYRNVEEDEAYLRFVEAIEAILAEEQQIYWQNRDSEPPARHQPKPAAPGDTVHGNV
jgi:hypothetical protein